MVWSLLGLSADQQAKGEVGSLNRTNTSFDSWDLFDRFRSGITGVSKEEVLKRAQQIATDRINETNAELIGKTNTALSGTSLKGTGGSTLYKPGQTEAAFVADLTTDQTRGTIAQTLLNDEDFTGTIDPNAGVGDLTRLAGETKKARRQRERTEKLKDTESDRSFQTGLLVEERRAQDARYNHQFKTGEARRAHEAQQSQLDRTLTRDLANSSDDLKMQIAQMNADLADKRMAYDRETKRMDRRDRAIAQLMAGLGQLGGAFSL